MAHINRPSRPGYSAKIDLVLFVQVQGDSAITGGKTAPALEATNTSAGTSDQHARHAQSTSKLGKIKEVLHLSK